ncbi:ATP-binding cassette domain-containing protein [Micromonospora sp. C51]|uniref:ABC transporter ATP-binding protein n=1 Tax=Micromonospora sp. C51 TaxID=2824879 RepID=UPI001FFC68C4|nr:ATP-binding cassette domain-containing protein [Micromonospora sp. C51]
MIIHGRQCNRTTLSHPGIDGQEYVARDAESKGVGLTIKIVHACTVTLIQAVGLRKVFRKPEKLPGLRGSLRHLVERRYSEHVAVDDIDLSIAQGEAVAYVGPNGAGKSTTVKMLSGILVPTAGQVRVDGLVPHLDRVENARRVGVVFGQRTQLWWDLPVRESLELLRDMHGIDRARYQAGIERLDSVLGIGELLPTPARKLSLGQRMRADLAAALIHEPRVVYLDEPTIGLDISVKDRVRSFVRQLVTDGTTVMLTTHDLADIEEICQRIVIIDAGRVVYDGDLRTVKDLHVRERSMSFELAESLSDAERVAKRLPGAQVRLEPNGRELTVTFDRVATGAREVLAAVLAEAEILDMHIEEPAIETVVRKVYAGQLRIDAGSVTEPESTR